MSDPEKLLEALVNELVDLFGWSDRSPLHAVMHVRNAVLKLRADLEVARRDAGLQEARRVAVEKLALPPATECSPKTKRKPSGPSPRIRRIAQDVLLELERGPATVSELWHRIPSGNRNNIAEAVRLLVSEGSIQWPVRGPKSGGKLSIARKTAP